MVIQFKLEIFVRMEKETNKIGSQTNCQNFQFKVSALKNTEQNLQDKFLSFISTQRRQKLYEQLRNFHGKNYVIRYSPQYNVTQQWQGNGTTDKFSDRNLLEENGLGYFIYSLIYLTVILGTIWTMSVERYFQTQQINSYLHFYEILLILTLSDIILNIYFQYQQTDFICIDFIKELKTNFYQIAVMTYICILAVTQLHHTIYFFIELFIMYLLYSRAKKIYSCMKVTEISLKYQNHIKILDLLFNIVIQAHAFAVILFSASKLSPDKNWVDAVRISQQSVVIKYIYSFYFASTTMLTIGYGDITPQGPSQIVITVFIEIVGVVSFGYLLSELGHTLSKMREQSQQLQRDIQTISKMSKYYNLEKKLQNKAKSFLISNQIKSEDLKIQDQNRVLLKLNEDLRQQIHHQNSLTIVKSCIFFLCHWSKDFQFQIAKRLQKRLFAPNQKIHFPSAPDRVFIIKRGKVDILTKRFASNQQQSKLLRVIVADGTKNVCDNIYGYTSAFSNRPVRLWAIAKQFTSTYSVTREAFLECIRPTSMDHEIDQSLFCEEWEAPSIKNIRQHYAPTRTVLIKKYRNALDKSSNKRKNQVRREKKITFRLLQNFIAKNDDQQPIADNTIVFTTRKLKNQTQPIRLVQSEDSQMANSIIMQDQSSSESSMTEENSMQISYNHAMIMMKTKQMHKGEEEKDNKLKIAHNFEHQKEYGCFFKMNNLSKVLYVYDRENFKQKNVKGFVSSMKNQRGSASIKNNFQNNLT